MSMQKTKKRFNQYFALTVVWIIFTLLSACASTQELAFDWRDGEMCVTVEIVGIDGTMILDQKQVGIKEGCTVLDATKFAARSRDIQLDYSGSGKSAYVKGIDNLYEFDHGSGSGWLYRVNRDFKNSGASCGAMILSDGDRIEWLYTKNLGEDVGLE